MPDRVYVCGHRNPDTDSICAAVAYAELLRLQGRAGVAAVRAGEMRQETAFVLERFGVEHPPLLADVRARVADVMSSQRILVQEADPLFKVGRVLQEAARAQ